MKWHIPMNTEHALVLIRKMIVRLPGHYIQKLLHNMLQQKQRIDLTLGANFAGSLVSSGAALAHTLDSTPPAVISPFNW